MVANGLGGVRMIRLPSLSVRARVSLAAQSVNLMSNALAATTLETSRARVDGAVSHSAITDRGGDATHATINGFAQVCSAHRSDHGETIGFHLY